MGKVIDWPVKPMPESDTVTAAEQRAMIWRRLHEYGPSGRYGISRATGIGPYIVSRRLAELVAQGLVRRVAGVCDLRGGSVWEVTA
jgi:DNA-binding HxlR family transcriptional regulator